MLGIVTRRAKRIFSAQHDIVISGLSGCSLFFYIPKRPDFRKKVAEHKIVF
jgi:hypothetical protein